MLQRRRINDHRRLHRNVLHIQNDGSSAADRAKRPLRGQAQANKIPTSNSERKENRTIQPNRISTECVKPTEKCKAHQFGAIVIRRDGPCVAYEFQSKKKRSYVWRESSLTQTHRHRRAAMRKKSSQRCISDWE